MKVDQPSTYAGHQKLTLSARLRTHTDKTKLSFFFYMVDNLSQMLHFSDYSNHRWIRPALNIICRSSSHFNQAFIFLSKVSRCGTRWLNSKTYHSDTLYQRRYVHIKLQLIHVVSL